MQSEQQDKQMHEKAHGFHKQHDRALHQGTLQQRLPATALFCPPAVALFQHLGV